MELSQLKRKTPLQTTAWVLATWFGAGCSPKAPGTIGSLFSLPLILIGYLIGVKALILTLIVLFGLGWWATDVVLKTQKEQDPGFVVIDETVGQVLSFVLITSVGFTWYYLVIGFALFRFFDIVKLWPASYFDQSVHTAFGVMMDDVIAGLYAAVTLYGITFFI